MKPVSVKNDRDSDDKDYNIYGDSFNILEK